MPATVRQTSGKRIVLCLDGTWNRADTKRHTNVVAMMRAIRPSGDDGRPQIVFYDKGVGTGGGLDRWLGGLGGRGLATNVRDAYIFLGNNWEPGDEVFVFGFSRGAFTARSLAGLIGRCGLLGRHSMARLPEAWQTYRRKPPRRPAGMDADTWRSVQAQRRQATMEALGARDARIRFLGVWDTVGSLGVPVRWFNPLGFLKRRQDFHDTELGSVVESAYHAVAVDEKRGAFPPTLWQKRIDDPLPQGQVVEQVWFAGVHSDVGGGYDEAPLAQVSLRWMQARASGCGLALRNAKEIASQRVEQAMAPAEAAQLVVPPDPLAMQHESRSLLYALSWLLPYQRVLGGQAAWTRKILPSRNRPRRGCMFVNEAIHESVVARWEQQVRVGRRWRTYKPRSVAAAKDSMPVARDEAARVIRSR